MPTHEVESPQIERHEIEQIALASLLHHMEDLLQRAGESLPATALQHWPQLRKWCQYDKWETIILEASQLAAGKASEQEGIMPHLPLSSLFSKIRLPETSPFDKPQGWLRPQILSDEPAYPQLTEAGKTPLEEPDYAPLCQALLTHLTNNEQRFTLNRVALLVEQYTALLPHETLAPTAEAIASPCCVSLYDHLKMTAAFAVCLYQLEQERKLHGDSLNAMGLQAQAGNAPHRYLIVAGDFSGVQDFVYSITSRGALKSLRARSFFLELMALHVVERLTEALELTPQNVIYASGGRFEILVPYRHPFTVNRLTDVRRSVNRYLADYHNARLYLALAWSDPSGAPLIFEDRHFQDAMQDAGIAAGQATAYQQQRRRLVTAIEVAKRRRFSFELDSSLDEFARLLEPFNVSCQVTARSAARAANSARSGVRDSCLLCNRTDTDDLHLKIVANTRNAPTLNYLDGCTSEACLGQAQSQIAELIQAQPDLRAAASDGAWATLQKPEECHVCHTESAFLLPLVESAKGNAAPSSAGATETTQGNSSEELADADIPRGELPRVCPSCMALYHLGEHLPQSRYLVRKRAYEPAKAVVHIADPTAVKTVETGASEIGITAPSTSEIEESPESTSLLAAEHFYYYLRHRLTEDDRRHADRIWLLNTVEGNDLEAAHWGTFYTANHQAWKLQDNRVQPLNFEELGRIATGINRIGVLRMDVDNLGDIFGQGLRDNASLVHSAALSRQMDLFFRFYLNQFCLGRGLGEAHHGGMSSPFSFTDFEPAPPLPSRWQDAPDWGMRGRRVVTVYAGGDDLFIAGAWDDVTEVAFDIEGAFRQFTAFNPDITLSGGIFLCPPRYPLYRMAALGKVALKNAKEHNEAAPTGGVSPLLTKGSLTLFFAPESGIAVRGKGGSALRWRSETGQTGAITVQDVVGLARRFLSFRDVSLPEQNQAQSPDASPAGQQMRPTTLTLHLSRGFLRRLFQVVEQHECEGGLSYFTNLVYFLAREAMPSQNERSLANWDELRIALMQLNTIRYLRPALTWVELLMRDV